MGLGGCNYKQILALWEKKGGRPADERAKQLAS
jgi:hypothetical protein